MAIRASTFQKHIQGHMLRIFDEVYGEKLGLFWNDTIAVDDADSHDRLYNFIDIVMMDDWPAIVSPRSWLW